jgi:hypothetical protein
VNDAHHLAALVAVVANHVGAMRCPAVWRVLESGLATMSFRKGHVLLTRALLRVVVVAIALAMCLRHSTHTTQLRERPTVTCDSHTEVPAVLAKARTLSWIAEAPLFERLPLASVGELPALAGALRRAAIFTRVAESRTSSVELVRALRHIPRMESGDPPRV